MHTKIELSLKPHFMSSTYRELYFLEYAFSSITLKILKPHNKIPNIFASHMFGL